MADLTSLRSTVQLRRDHNSAWELANPILKAGEVGVVLPTEDDTANAFKFKIGNGVTAWNDGLPWANSIGGSESIAVDENTIFLNADGSLSLVGFDEATTGMIPSKGENGKLVWVVPTEVPDIEELKTKVDALDETVNGKPAGSDPTTEPAVPGLVDKVEELEKQITGDPENPSDDSLAAQVKKNTDNISALTTNLNDNYYNKEEVDDKIAASYKPGETLENVSELPSPPTSSDLGVIHPIQNAGTTTDDFIGGAGQPVPAGSQVVAIEKDGEIKYNIMPSNVDLSGYLKTEQLGSEFTTGTDGKIEINEIAQSKVIGLPEALASKISGISIDGTELEVTNGVVGLPLATALRAGLVKSCSTDAENGVEVNSDGTMKVINMKVNVNNLVQDPDDDLVLDGGGAAG